MKIQHIEIKEKDHESNQIFYVKNPRSEISQGLSQF